ncbi:unnamed protein product [Cunninghamella blakesleeana]
MNNNVVVCVKKNMYDKELKYIAVSYRWGELNEQLVKTPDYTAHITSFSVDDLKDLCHLITGEPHLSKIPYLWIDAISVNQHDHMNKKSTILKMSEIYKRANYILAVPDLHKSYLIKNPANQEIFYLIQQFRQVIYNDIHQIQQLKKPLLSSSSSATTRVVSSIKKKLKGSSSTTTSSKNKENNEEIKRVYQFLAFLIDDWSNRAWVISEYQIAKEKQQKMGTPIKYIFISLLYLENYFNELTFFSYSFDDHHLNEKIDDQEDRKGKILRTNYESVDSSSKLIQYFKTRFTKRHHLHMILNSNATRNEDRFNAILPSWEKYRHFIQDKNTISEWKITNMVSVRLKIYELMSDDVLETWNKARLLYACSMRQGSSSYIPLLPTFASQYDHDRLYLFELENPLYALGRYTSILCGAELLKKGEKGVSEVKTMLQNHIKETKKYIYKRNLGAIKLIPINQLQNHPIVKRHDHLLRQAHQIQQSYHHHKQFLSYDNQYPYFLSVHVLVYFIVDMKCNYSQEFLSSIFSFPTNNNSETTPTIAEQLTFVYIPFFIFDFPQYQYVPPIECTGITLLGSMVHNKWIIVKTPTKSALTLDKYKGQHKYIFHIY